MARKTTTKTPKGSEIMIVYANDIAYIGEIDPSETEVGSSGIVVRNPFVLNIRPITGDQDGKLEAVVLDIMLPVEFAGLPLSATMYTGFVNFTHSPVALPSGKAGVMNMGDTKVSVNRISSLVDKNEPLVWLFNVQKIVMPSDDMLALYMHNRLKYEETLNSARMVDLQAIADEQMEPTDDKQQSDFTGNVVTFGGNNTVH